MTEPDINAAVERLEGWLLAGLRTSHDRDLRTVLDDRAEAQRSERIAAKGLDRARRTIKALEASVEAAEAERDDWRNRARDYAADQAVAEAKLARIAELHWKVDSPNGDYCCECSSHWPCETAIILNNEGTEK